MQLCVIGNCIFYMFVYGKNNDRGSYYCDQGPGVQCLELRRIWWLEDGENCMMKYFVICTAHQALLFGWSEVYNIRMSERDENVCKFWHFHGSVIKDSGLLGCNTSISKKCVSRIVFIKSERKRLFERPKCKWENNFKLDLIVFCMYSLDTSDDVSERSSSAESRPQTCPTSSTTTRSLREVKKSRVQFYDHANRFESDHQHQIRVERMFPHANEVSLSMHAYFYIVCGHMWEPE